MKLLILRFFVFAISCVAIPLYSGDGEAPFFIEGYSGQVSYAPGEELTLHISTSAASF